MSYTRDLSVLGLGHVLLTVKDTQRTHDFYTGVLGFRLSDWVCIDDNIRLRFLRCNARHHSLAFAPCRPGKLPRLQHVMLEVESLDDVMRSYHFLRIRKAPIGMGPGRHIKCQTVHVYVQTPGWASRAPGPARVVDTGITSRLWRPERGRGKIRRALQLCSRS